MSQCDVPSYTFYYLFKVCIKHPLVLAKNKLYIIEFLAVRAIAAWKGPISPRRSATSWAPPCFTMVLNIPRDGGSLCFTIRFQEIIRNAMEVPKRCKTTWERTQHNQQSVDLPAGTLEDSELRTNSSLGWNIQRTRVTQVFGKPETNVCHGAMIADRPLIKEAVPANFEQHRVYTSWSWTGQQIYLVHQEEVWDLLGRSNISWKMIVEFKKPEM